MVSADTHILARVETGTTLANEDISGYRLLASEELHTKALAFRIATVAGTTTCFLVCHDILPRLTLDCGDLDFGIPLAMTCTLHVVLAAPKLDNANLVVASLANHLGNHLGSGNKGGTYFYIGTFAYHQYLAKLNAGTDGLFNLFQFESLTLNNTVLLSTADNHCVHSRSPILACLRVVGRFWDKRGTDTSQF
jgi:hypothetical protein